MVIGYPVPSRVSWLRHLVRHWAAVGAVMVATTLSSAAPGLKTAPLDYHATVLNGKVTGSAFLISDGVAVTNAHVLNGRRAGETVVIATGSSGRRVQAQVLAVSNRMDLAVLRVNKGLLPVVSPNFARVRRGGALIAAGVVANPDGPGARKELVGHVSSKLRNLPPYGPGVIVAMPGVRRGFSGGPVFDGSGHLVGMIAALRPATGVGKEAFVLSADAVRDEVRRLLRAL